MDKSKNEIFLIDTNAFLTPYKNYYQFSFAPSFWNQLNEFSEQGRIVTLDKVTAELCKEVDIEKKDAMQIWIEENYRGVGISSSNAGIIEKYAVVMQHLSEDKKYSEKALREWANIKIADPWLIAAALEFNYTVVSFETKLQITKNSTVSRAKIPNICEDLNVNYCNLFYMMQELKFKL